MPTPARPQTPRYTSEAYRRMMEACRENIYAYNEQQRAILNELRRYNADTYRQRWESWEQVTVMLGGSCTPQRAKLYRAKRLRKSACITFKITTHKKQKCQSTLTSKILGYLSRLW